MVINSCDCAAINEEGEPCMGKPIVKEYQEVSPHKIGVFICYSSFSSILKGKLDRKGHFHFIACSGWSKKWWEGHWSYSIPDRVNEDVLVKLSNAEELQAISCIPTCARIVRSQNGALKCSCGMYSYYLYRYILIKSYAGYPHNLDGSLSKLIKHKCDASWTIFVPVDPSIRHAVLVFSSKKTRSVKPEPHSHPILP